MDNPLLLKLLFIINPASGNNNTDWKATIAEYFHQSDHVIEWFVIEGRPAQEKIRQVIKDFAPHRVIAVGGDGTVKLAAECVMETGIPIGIVPAGSANGLAKELLIPSDLNGALDIIVQGHTKSIHVTRVNDQYCIHLSDVGFNAYVIKTFESGQHRGMWGYVKSAWKVLWNQPRMLLDLRMDNHSARMHAAMVVIANATQYGSGARINPDGKLDDHFFEIVVVKKVSILEVLKMMYTRLPFDETKTEVFQVRSAEINSRRKAHFQVDGEYLGKVNKVSASIMVSALELIVGEESQ